MNFDEVRQIAFSFPGVTEHVVFGGPTLRIGKRFLAGIAQIDPDTLVLKVPNRLEREFFLATKPEIYYLTPHYEPYKLLLARMPLADPQEVRQLFEDAWRTYAPKRVVAQYKAKHSR